MNDVSFRVILGLALLALSLVARAVSRNRLVRRKLRLSILLFAVYAVVSFVLLEFTVTAEMAGTVLSVNRLLLALASINLVVVVLINPLRVDRVPERFPAIVQDTIIIGFFMLVATVALQEKFLTTSAVGAVVIGFALQDTLGNTFAGLAIQVEKPFKVGHWVAIGPHEGRVVEVNWRATNLRTKAGNLVVLPNAFISKEAIVNFSEPEAPTRLQTTVGVSYDVPPNQVKAAIRDALEDQTLVCRAPAPEVFVAEFGSSSINYLIRFWVNDYGQDTAALDQVRSATYYALRRHGYEIPFPIQVEYHRETAAERPSDRIDRLEAVLAPIDLFAPLTREERIELAMRSKELLFGRDETIVRQDDPGSSMFVIIRGRVRVVEASGRELAVFDTGGYFGEMSMLTGQLRSASVQAINDCQVLELTAESLRAVALANPDVLTRISAVVAVRRADLERQKAQHAADRAEAEEAPLSLLERIQAFLGLPSRLRG
jgi:small-conductance mechanosensitive channel/CRP-like cAMP-binding protein